MTIEPRLQDFAERIVDEYDRVVVLPRVGDDHRHARGGHERIGSVIDPGQLGADARRIRIRP